MKWNAKEFNKNYSFEQIPTNSKKGYKNVYTYIGNSYSWDLSSEILRKKRFLFFFLEIVTCVVFVLSSIQPLSFNATRFSAITGLLSLLCWVFEVIAICFFCFAKLPLTEEDYIRINSTFTITFPARALLLSLTAISGLCTASFQAEFLKQLAVSVGYLICAAISFSLSRQYTFLKNKTKITPHHP